MQGKKWSSLNYLELDFFSGAPNPRWEVTPAIAQGFLDRIKQLPIRDKDAHYLEPNSWYGGVVLHLAEPHGPGRYLTIDGEHVFDSDSNTVFRDADRQFERFLFEAAPQEAVQLIDRMSFEAATAPLNEIHGVEFAALVTATPVCAQAPTFQIAPPPVPWNTKPGLDDNNCYNYGNDVFSIIDDALPGGIFRHEWTEKEMHDLVTGDGLVPANPANNKVAPSTCPTHPNTHLVAVCLRRRQGTRTEAGVAVPNYKDFHCFRLDGGGVWSHKDGRKRTRNTDNSGDTLLNLAAARFKLKNTLVGYYWTFPGPHRKIRTPS